MAKRIPPPLQLSQQDKTAVLARLLKTKPQPTPQDIYKAEREFFLREESRKRKKLAEEMAKAATTSSSAAAAPSSSD